MKIPLSWLKDYVEIILPPEAMAERLTLAGLEVSSITRIGDFWEPDKLFVGQILSVTHHPDADRLTLARVDYGADSGPLTVVTGAPNLYPYIGREFDGDGPKVAFAVTGARLYDGHSEEKRLVRLKASKIRGVESQGMACSEKELGLSDEHEGILILPDDAPVGMPLSDYLGDTVMELDVKGAFGHLQCVMGIARETAALTNQPLNRDVLTVLHRQPAEITSDAAFTGIVIEDPDLCGRYSAALIEGVAIGPSPLWMQQRLQRAGMRPINNVVDITNYVMLEIGQPLHAFDYDLLRARAGGDRPSIIMRRANVDETMQTLDGVTRTLDPEMLMITDTAGPIAVGGVMGGAETEIGAGTTNILLEAANFDFLSIRRTSQMLKLSSEAASRFGKRVDPELTVKALARAGQLLEQLAGGVVRRQFGDVYPGKPEAVVILLDLDYVNAVLGSDIPAAEMARILSALEFGMSERQDGLFDVLVPSHRLDVRIPADLAEEVGRIYGYDRLTPTLLASELPPQRRNLALEGQEKIRDIMTGCGLDEVITYSIVDLNDEARLTGAGSVATLPPHVRVLNPLSGERSNLRRMLMPELLNAARANLRFNERVTIFELGRVFQPRPEETLPAEPVRLGAVMVGPREPSSWLGRDATPMGFFDLKGVVEELLRRLDVSDVVWERGAHPALHPGRTARLMVGGKDAGVIGELHPTVRAAFGLLNAPVAVMELDVDVLLADWGEAQPVSAISQQPAVYEDLAVVVDEGAPAEQVVALIRQTGGKLLTEVRLFDVYRGGQVPAGKKSLACALTFQAPDRTLTDEETAKLRAKIVSRLERELGATLRS
jgi:phenylalanyl-tRNA synthetase beta chain